MSNMTEENILVESWSKVVLKSHYEFAHLQLLTTFQSDYIFIYIGHKVRVVVSTVVI